MDITEVKQIKDLLDAQGTAWAEFKKVNDERIAKLEKGQAVGDLEAKLVKINEDLDAKGKALEDVQKKLNRPGRSDKEESDIKSECERFNNHRASVKQLRGGHTGSGPISLDQYIAYKSAFHKAVRYGVQALDGDEAKAMSTGVDTEGGFLMPEEARGRVVSKIYELSPIRQIAAVQPITTDTLEGMYDNGEADAGWVGETGTRSETNSPQVGQWSIPVFEMYAAPKATQKLLDDAAVNVETWLAGKVANKFARKEGAAFVVGNGVSQPRGFTTYPVAATNDDSRAWGTMEVVKTGVAGNFAASAPADVLFDLEGAFRPGYTSKASWVTRRDVITKVRKFKGATTGDYLWQPGLQMNKPDTLLGYPIVLAQDMPALADGSLSMALGDFTEGYQVVDRIGIRTLRDPFTNKPFVIFYSTMRVGGAVVNFEAIKFVQFGA